VPESKPVDAASHELFFDFRSQGFPDLLQGVMSAASTAAQVDLPSVANQSDFLVTFRAFQRGGSLIMIPFDGDMDERLIL
jgi:hypothetical protein